MGVFVLIISASSNLLLVAFRFVVPRRTIHGSLFDGLDEGNSKLPGVNVEAWAATHSADGVTYHSKSGEVTRASQKVVKLSSNMKQDMSKDVQVQGEEEEEEALNSKLKSQLKLARAEYNRAKGGLDKSVGDYENELRKQETLNAQLKAQLKAAQGVSSSTSGAHKDASHVTITSSSAASVHDNRPFNPYGILARSPSEPHLVGGVLSSNSLESGPDGVLARAPSDTVNVDGPLASTHGQPDSGFGLLGRVADKSEDGDEQENSRDAEGSLAEVVGHDGDAGGTLTAAGGDDMWDGVLDRVAPEPGSSGLLSRVPPSTGTLSAVNGDDMADGVLKRVASESTADGVLTQVPSSDGLAPAENRAAVDGPLSGLGSESGADGPLGDVAARGRQAVDGSLSGFAADEGADGPLGDVVQQAGEFVDGSLAAVPSTAAGRDGALSAVGKDAVDGALFSFSGKRGRGGILAEVGRLGSDAIGGSLSGFPRSASQDGVLAEIPTQSRASIDGSLAAVAPPQAQETGAGQSPAQAAVDGALAALPRSRSDRDGPLAGVAGQGSAAATAGLLAALPRSADNRDGDLAGTEWTGQGQAAVDGSLAILAESATGRDGSLSALPNSQDADGVLARVRDSARKEAEGGSLSMLRARGSSALGLLGRAPAVSDPVGVLATVAARRRAWVAEQVRLHSLHASQVVMPLRVSQAATPHAAGISRVSASEVRKVKQWEKEVQALRSLEAHRLAAVTAMEAAAKRDGRAAAAARSRAFAEEASAGQDAQVAAAMRARAVVAAAAAARAAGGVARKAPEVVSRKSGVAKPAAESGSEAHPRRIRRRSNPTLLQGAAAAAKHGAKLPEAARKTTQAAQTVRGAYRQLEESDEAEAPAAEAAGGKAKAEDDVGWVKRRWTAWGWTLFAVFGPVVTAAVTAMVTVWAGPVAGVCTFVIMLSMDVCSYYYSWYTV